MVPTALETGNAHRGLAAFEAFLPRRGERYRRQPQALRLASALYGEAGAAESVLGRCSSNSNSVRQTVARWRSEVLEDGELRPEVDPDVASRVFLAAFRGVGPRVDAGPGGCRPRGRRRCNPAVHQLFRLAVSARQEAAERARRRHSVLDLD